MYNQTNNVNIKPKSYLPEFHVSQNDVGRTLTAHLVSDDGDVTIPIGVTVTMAGTKPSGLGYTVAGTVDGSDVSFNTDAVMTDEPGRIVSEIRIVQGDTVIGTTNVVLSVEPNPHPDDVTDGQREPLINEITALLHAIEEQAEQVAENTRIVEQAMDAWTNMTAEAETLPAGSEASALYDNGVLLLGIPAGPQGEQGEQGPQGETGPKGDKGDPGEVSLETLAKVMVSDTASGSIASFPDGTDILPAISVLDSIEPIQEGSGTPSPTNIRPISGRTEVVTSRCGVNVWDEEWEVGNIDPSSGANISSTTQIRSKNYIQVKPNTTIYLYSAVGGTFNYRFYKADKTYLRGTYYGANQTLAIPEEVYYMRFAMGGSYGTTYNHDISINYPSTDHDYHAYQGHTYTTDLPQTVYGGTLDVVSGVLTVTHGYISSYNGETINEPWISDRDEYVAGTTPTTGAQVVYTLATPTTIQCDPQTVQTLIGDNNVWGGDAVVVDYYADTKLYIEKMLGA